MKGTVLQIPTPCHEPWDAMSPRPGGRHCAACAKTVVDFSTLTDQQILAVLKQSGTGALCGRFQEGQLDRVLRPAPRKPRYLTAIQRIAASLVVLQATWTQAFSQERKAPVSTEQGPRHPAANLAVYGKVLDVITRQPVPGVRLTLTVSDQAYAFDAVTDKRGRFSFRIPRDLLSQGTVNIAPMEEHWQLSDKVDYQINSIRIPVKDLGLTEPVLYRYAAERLPEAQIKVKRWVKPLVQGGMVTRYEATTGLVVRQTEPVARRSFFQRLNPFGPQTRPLQTAAPSLPEQQRPSTGSGGRSIRQRWRRLFSRP